jgi:DNA-directed RNA polymerase-3 subunit RPC5
MTIKAASTAADGEDAVAQTVVDRLRGVQIEGWHRMDYAHEDTEAAWDAYQENLFLRPEGALEPVVNDDNAENAGDEDQDVDMEDSAKEKDGDADPSGAADLHARVPHLATNWGEDELLRAVSGISRTDKKPGEEAVSVQPHQPATALQGSGKASARGKGKGKAAAIKMEDKTSGEPKKRPGRPPKNAATGTSTTSAGSSRRGGKARTSTRETNVMELD